MFQIIEVHVRKLLVLSCEKSHFIVMRGNLVSSKGLEVDKTKIEDIQNLSLPTTWI